ncbi:MAG: thioredoxin domain-containing protein [Bacteroidia bacterium]
MKKLSNRLSKAGSPYLLQHQYNPVDWYEWGDEALEKSKTENKPLIISIGYAACHWCHVMEHECFEDNEVAKLMNDNFVCIKVDREERPDIDQIYMDACMILNGNGGWPLNACALPDGKPFYAGTYFPKQNWMSVLAQIINLYKNDYTGVSEQAEAITEGINRNELIQSETSDKDFSEDEFRKIYNNWKPLIDLKDGGYDKAPKFPLPIGWEFLLHYYYLTKDQSALDAVQITLDKMALGGIYDQVGGGFARYSVDKIWLVPHFEKMLYDNGQLISLYSNAYKITGSELYKEIVYETIEFIERELTSPQGGFYSALNADSEGEEGKFYVWNYDEFVSLFNDEEGKLLAEFYNIKKEGNWEHGKNIPHITVPKEGFISWHKLNEGEFEQLLKISKQKLLAKREERVRPSTDDKILTSWNALVLSGLINAYTAFGENKFMDLAIKNANFLLQNMMNDDGSLFRNYKNNTASITAFHDDYALLINAFIKLYEVTFNEKWLNKALQLTDYTIEHFYDYNSHLFYYTSDLGEKLVARKKEISDNVIPSSNSVMAHNLFRLGKLQDNNSYLEMSMAMLKQVEQSLIKGGPYFSNWAKLAGKILYGTYEVAITGLEALKYNSDMQKQFLPNSIFMGSKERSNLPLLEEKYIEGKTFIYVCKNNTCQRPVEFVEEALNQINHK